MKIISSILPALLTTAVGALFPAHETLQLNCTDQNPVFTLKGIYYYYREEYDSPTHLASKGATITFNLANTAVQYLTPCSASFQEYYVGTNITYQCITPSDATAGSSANFTLTGRTGTYTVNQTWTCGK
jgi:Alternaria alternata allergen 1